MPKGFLVFFAAALIFETAVHFFPEYALYDPPYGEKALRIKNALVDQPNTYEILILGDCYGWAGIRPTTLERNLQMKAFNLSVNMDQTFMIEYILLKRYLRNSLRKPKLVILQLSPGSLMENLKMSPEIFLTSVLPYFRVDTDLLDELSPETRNQYLRYSILSVLPSVKRQFLIKNPFWLFRLWTADKSEFDKLLQSFILFENGFSNTDASAQTKADRRPIRDINGELKTGQFSEFNIAYIKKILGLLEEHGIRTIVTSMPARKDSLIFWSRYRVRERTNDEVRSLIKGYENVTGFLDLVDILPSSSYFSDANHLNSKGADKISDILSEEIKRLNLLEPAAA